MKLEVLIIGTSEEGLSQGKHNKFYGSLWTIYQNLTKLKKINTETTNVDSDLEYLPESLAQKTQRESNHKLVNNPFSVK